MIDLYFGIDCSMRSTGCCVLGSDGKIIDMIIIRPPKELTMGEDVIQYHHSFLKRWIPEVITPSDRPHFMIEKIAIGGKNASKEIIAGVNWHIRWQINQMFNCGVVVDEVVVNTWRAGVITKDVRKRLKEEGIELKKEQIKIETYNLLTPAAKECIDTYVTRENLWGVKAHYDLTDSYFIAEYCRNKHIKGDVQKCQMTQM